jgi:hypothetical protein
VSRRVAAPAVALALLAGLSAGCGEKEEHVPGPSRAEVAALVAAGLRAAASDATPTAVRFRAGAGALRIRLASPLEGALDSLLAPFDRVGARVEQFCPKPALLSCAPAVRAWASPSSRQAIESSVVALRRLAARTYEGRLLVHRRGALTSIVTPNGELLAAVRALDGQVTMSFGGLAAPRDSLALPPAGVLGLQAGEEALEAMRRDLPPRAGRALAGVERLTVVAPLP